jgi:drug/metabolite transporter (DMT)-like permease
MNRGRILPYRPVRKPGANDGFANAKGRSTVPPVESLHTLTCLYLFADFMSSSAPPIDQPHAQRRWFIVGLAMALIGAVLFSGKAIVVKLLYRHQVDAMTVLAFRMLFSLPAFGIIALVQMKRQAPLAMADRWRIVQLGLLGYYLSSYLDFIGLAYISAGLERLILFLTPSFVLLMSVFLLKKRVSSIEWLALAICYGGTILVFVHDVRLGGTNVLVGGAFVLGSALSYAMYLLFSGELVQRVGTLRLVSYVICVSALASVAQFLLLRPPALLLQPTEVYGLSVINAVFCTVLPVFLTMMAIARVGAPVASLAGMAGPVSTLFFAAWLLQEPIAGMQLAGTALVLVGIYLLSRKKT